ncbi:hypothetical protein [Nitrogeniibacter aestuarii]|uniref:hypothetical protein n=1 Tax=Nitrogeniibacter aestuarii TaxID=2815343 RepID=UPI001D100522|nr:hypothetical protein [Nitrogeniibacter aestuarii]
MPIRDLVFTLALAALAVLASLSASPALSVEACPGHAPEACSTIPLQERTP